MIAVVDYGVCNTGSIRNMLRKVGAEVVVTSDVEQLANADKIILPGVGAFSTGMNGLRTRGLVPVLNDHALNRRKPILGICLGMQMFTAESEESTGDKHEVGLGWIDAKTVGFRPSEDEDLRLPHMGWNTIDPCSNHPILAGLEDDSRFYFVHSYHVQCHDPNDRLCLSHYGSEFTSAVAAGNIVGTQFHPEKSHRFGMQLLRNFAHEC
jgi:glutamine amidotransferase